MINPIKKLLVRGASLLTLIAVTASADDSSRQILVKGKLPMPAHIWIYNFASTPAEIPSDSAVNGRYSAPATPPTAEQLAEGYKIGGDLAAALVEEFKKLKMPAEVATSETKPDINDIVARGCVLSVEKDKSVVLGIGSEKSKLVVALEGYQVTTNGLRKLGSGDADPGSGRSGIGLSLVSAVAKGNPLGLVIQGGKKIKQLESGIDGRVPKITEQIIKVLRPRMEEFGWIEKKKGLF